MKLQRFRCFVFIFLITANAIAAAQSTQEIEALRTQAEQGSATEQFDLGVAYWNGDGVTQDKREAVIWFRKAAKAGDVAAQFNLGIAYENGEGVGQDKQESVRWYRKAAEQGHAVAQYNLGVLFWFGEGVAQDKQEAVRWFRKAAEQGHAVAQYNLGIAYGNGKGVAQDIREAVRWYRKAAEQGNADAQNNLGYAYSNGKGVAKDIQESVRWYRKAAEQGNAGAQYILGITYDIGEGVTQDNRESVRWYRKAAEQGIAGAQSNLAQAYWNGEGVITDKYEAYIWWSIAKANGNESATTKLQTFDDLQENGFIYLSQSEIRAALKEAKHRLEVIENRDGQFEEQSLFDSHSAIVATPQTINPATQVFENTWRSVVVIHNGSSQGSGVIIHPNIVATNCHVVDEGGKIVVYKSENRRADTDTVFLATIRRADESRDFCLLDVAGLWGIPATVRRYDTLKVGEAAFALGAPEGLDLSLSDGLVSQLREIESVRLIQTNAAISPGSSGGGLFDSESNLIGIMTWKITDESTEGIGFAIPAELALE